MWFVETPWPPIIISLVLSAVFFSRWNQKRKRISLVIAIVLLVLSPGIYLIEQNIVTEKEKLEENIYELSHAFQQGQVKETLFFVHQKDIIDQARIKKALSLIEVGDDLRITDIRIKISQDDSLSATTLFRANGTILFRNKSLGYKPSRWKLSWYKDGTEWKIIQIEQLHIVNGEPIKTPI
jgi:hypothetical protein